MPSKFSGHSHAGIWDLVLENWHKVDNLTSCVNPDFSGKGGGGWGSLDRQMLLKTWNAAKYSPPRYRLCYYPPPLPSVLSKAQWESRGDRWDELSPGLGPRKRDWPQYCQRKHIRPSKPEALQSTLSLFYNPIVKEGKKIHCSE